MTEIVYIGRRKLKGSKYGHCFIALDKLQQLLERRLIAYDTIDQWSSPFEATKSAAFPKAIGGVLETEHDLKIDEEGRINSINYGKLKFIRIFDCDLIANWRIADELPEQEKRMASFVRRHEESAELNKAVQILKQQYKSVSPGYRRSFQVWLLNELDKR